MVGSMEKELHLITRCFPPMNVPRSIQISRLVMNLKMKLNIYCGFDTQNYDNSISPSIGKHVSKYGGNIFTIKENNYDRFKKKIISKFYDSFFFPDNFKLWSHKAMKIILSKKLIKKESTIISFSQPISDHFIGYNIKKKIGCKWILHFSDPWSINPYLKLDQNTKNKVILWEKQFFKVADKIIFTSTETANAYKNLYKKYKKKIYILNHISPELLPEKKNKNKKITFRYLGSLYEDRSPITILKAIDFLKKNKPNLNEKIKIEFIGDFQFLSSKIKNEIKKYARLSDIVTFKKKVSYKKSLMLMRNSDVLIVIDSFSKNKNLFFPSKLVDYMATNKTIIGITGNGETKKILTKIDGYIFNHHQFKKLAILIDDIITKKKVRKIKKNLDYKSDSVKDKFIEIINFKNE